VPGTDTTSSTYTHTRVETDTNTGTVTNTETVSWTNTNTATNTVTSTVTVTSTQTKTSTTDGGVPSGCLQDWRNSGPCGEWCLRETQSDRQACKVFLDCYRDHDCGPSTCGGQDDVCGVNKFSYGMAPKTIADQVYACLACPGSAPVTSCSNYPDTTPCTDGDACTQNDKCQAGVCVPGAPVVCDTGDQCNDPGVCNPSTGLCSKVPKPDDTPCDDSSLCTPGQDVCKSGLCTGQDPVTCPPAGDQCHENVCDPTTGTCGIQQKQDKTPCDDQDACSQKDFCINGACIGTDLVECKAKDTCHAVGTCDKETGVCSDPPIDKVGCNIHLRMDGTVAKLGPDGKPDGNLIAILGYNSDATTPFHPTLENKVLVNGVEVQIPQPPPPAYLLPGTHPGTFLATFTPGSKITWRVDGVDADATGTKPTLTQSPDGSGTSVVIADGTTVPIVPNLDPYTTQPADPPARSEPPHGLDFHGTLLGQLTTSPTGAAIYTLPISLPRGINGMGPNLSLIYNSQKPQGIAGQGWHLAGLSTIYRCEKTWVQDGYVRPVMMDTTYVDNGSDGDGVCLDGQRLFKVGSDSGKTIFEPEQKDFSQVYYVVNTNHFEVHTKSGEVRSYGKTTKARVQFRKEDLNGPVSPAQWVTAIWALERVQDAWGNYYEIEYNNNMNGSNEPPCWTDGLRATAIKYTSHDADTTNSAISPMYTVTFGYQLRQDTRRLRFRHSSLPINALLSSITTPRGTYTLTYAPYDPLFPSRLTRIAFCAKSSDNTDVCLEPLDFGWTSHDMTWTSGPNSTGDPAWSMPVDAAGSGTALIDLNADGLPDLVQAKAIASDSHGGLCGLLDKRRTWQNSGTGWQERVLLWGKFPEYLARADGSAVGTVFADFDGDGRPDVIADHKKTYCPSECNTSDPGYPWGSTCDCSTIETLCSPIIGHLRESPAVHLNRLGSYTGAWYKDQAHSGDNLKQAIANIPSLPGFAHSDWNDLNFLRYEPEKGINVDIDGDGKPDVLAVPPKDYAVDIDGDGKTELVHVNWITLDYCYTLPGCKYRIDVLRYGSSGWTYDGSFSFIADFWHYGHHFFDGIADVNRDGLPDLLTIDGSVFFNLGKPGKGINGSAWILGKDPNAPPWPKYDPAHGPPPRPMFPLAADVDGDGQHDILTQSWSDSLYPWGLQCCLDAPVSSKLYLNAGQGTWLTDNGSYNASLLQYAKLTPTLLLTLGAQAKGRFNFLDFNADGLADLVINDGLNGTPLVNTGTKWLKLQSATVHDGTSAFACNTPKQTPYGPEFGAALKQFTDLNGDGVPDSITVGGTLVQIFTCGMTSVTGYINEFSPAIITSFPNGLAAPTSVNYSVISSPSSFPSVYEDSQGSNSPNPGAKLARPPVRVVSSIVADNGVGSKNTTTYKYWNFRVSASGRGSQGFERIDVVDPTGVLTRTTYAQAFPYTGQPVKVERSKNGELTTTTTDYCDAVAPSGANPSCSPLSGQTTSASSVPVFVYPIKVTDVSYLRTTTTALPEHAKEAVTATTEYVYDKYGNPTKTTVTTRKLADSWSCPGVNSVLGTAGASSTGSGGMFGSSTGTTVDCDGEAYEKVASNDYGSSDSEERKHGRVKKTIVKTTQLSGSGSASSHPITHTTSFEYLQDGTLALSKKMVEPGTGVPIELHTAYGYDRFGNVDRTTECASDFTECSVFNPDGPAKPSEPYHPRFRTTKTSYKVSLFSPPPPAGADSNDPGTSPVISELEYSDGLFPVVTTNSLGHVQYTAFDPYLGSLVQTTDANGIYTCTSYDAVGWKRSDTYQCGSDQPLKTTYDRYWAPSNQGNAEERVMTATHLSNGSASWSYSDKLGRPVRGLARSFSGGFVQTTTGYDKLGRVSFTTRPAETSPSYSPYYTRTYYDILGRPEKVTQELGTTDGTSKQSSATSTTTIYTYHGSGITTNSGQGRVRTEVKNGLGRVASVTDANNSTITYGYDVDGNLTDVYDGDSPPNHIGIHYDIRGRKTDSSDPDMGSWSYEYNGFGDLIGQTDAVFNVTAMTYDRLGRVLTRTYQAPTKVAQTAEWVYDQGNGARIGRLSAMISAPDERFGGACTGVPYVTNTSGNRAGRWFTYDALGRTKELFECADGDTFSIQYEYDDRGRQKIVRYPEIGGNRLAVHYNYTSLGFLHFVTEASAGNQSPAAEKVLWQATAVNAAGQVTDEILGNGVETVSTRNPVTGWLLDASATSQADSDNLIQGLSYKFDAFGNVLTRTRSAPRDMADSVETFGYDLLDRLTSSSVTVGGVSTGTAETYTYDGIGNLKTKGSRTLSYREGCALGGGPHTVCKLDNGPAFSYDSNGNLTAGNGRTVTYSSFNKVSHIELQASNSNAAPSNVDVLYGADGNRVVQVTGGNTSARTVYVSLGGTGRSIYERTSSGSTLVHVHFLYAGGAHEGNAFALRVATQANASSSATFATKFQHFDHLGSITATSDETGKVSPLAWGGSTATAYGYDAWGARRSPDGKAATYSLPSVPGHREYTGQEAIPGLGLVNMNGRVYDPDLGRFLSPDPNIQFVADLQSYNRYSYVRNNPLKLTDPTGYVTYSHPDVPPSLAERIGTTAVITAMGIAMCYYGTAASCYAFMAWSAFFQIEQGVPWDRVLIGTAASYVSGQLAGAAVGEILGEAASVGASIAGGAIAGGISATFTHAALSGQIDGSLGETFLWGALAGALSAGIRAGSDHHPLSQASAQQGGGGGSGADRVRDLVTTKAMMKGVGGGGEGLTVDQATLDQYTKGTRLEGRARIDRSLAGKEALGVTEGIGGRVRISPDAFASDALLTNVVGHEGVHVSQIVAGNFADKWASSAHNVNELEAYRQSSAAGRNFGDPAYSENWGVQMDKIAELVHDLQYTPYYKQATTWPYNYQLQSGDICSACSW